MVEGLHKGMAQKQPLTIHTQLLLFGKINDYQHINSKNHTGIDNKIIRVHKELMSH